jgi:hypothetical protein
MQRPEEWLTQLDRLGLIRRGAMKGCQEILKEPPPGNLSANVLEALLDERRDCR